MTITTEEAERLAKEYGGFWGLHDVAAALRSLAAERDEAMKWRAAIDDAHTKKLMPIEDNPADALQRLIEAESNVAREKLQARVAELESLAWGLMLAMSASRYDFAEILKEARATLEGKKDD